LFFRFDGAHVRAIFTPRYTPVDNTQIIQRLFELGYGHNTSVQATRGVVSHPVTFSSCHQAVGIDSWD
jgi:hypothetical protein